MRVEAPQPKIFKRSARVPHLNQLAREFGRDKAHIWRICTGQSGSPLRLRVITRQAELIRLSEAATPQQHTTNAAEPVAQPAEMKASLRTQPSAP
jgi:hypothetical protein